MRSSAIQVRALLEAAELFGVSSESLVRAAESEPKRLEDEDDRGQR